VNGNPISHKVKKTVKDNPLIRMIIMGITGKIQKIAVKKRTLKIMEIVNSANSDFPSGLFFIAGPLMMKTDPFFRLDKKRNIKNLRMRIYRLENQCIAKKVFH